MNIALIIDIDTERESESIITIQQVKRIGDKVKPTDPNADIITEMAALCEAVCTLIHVADQNNIKESSKSLRDCINHLQNGFADAGYIGIIKYPHEVA